MSYGHHTADHHPKTVVQRHRDTYPGVLQIQVYYSLGFMGEWIGARDKQIAWTASRTTCSFPHEPREKDILYSINYMYCVHLCLFEHNHILAEKAKLEEKYLYLHNYESVLNKHFIARVNHTIFTLFYNWRSRDVICHFFYFILELSFLAQS